MLSSSKHGEGFFSNLLRLPERVAIHPTGCYEPLMPAPIPVPPWPRRQPTARRPTIERALILWPAPVIEPVAFPERIAARAPAPASSAPTLEDTTRVLRIDSSTSWSKRRRCESE